MDEKSLRSLICEAGRLLLSEGLVARTWGNVSCRMDDTHILITPSGLDYLQTREEDIVCVALPGITWTGARKPSSEKGVHAVAYETFPDVRVVVHTHQTYASALGLADWDNMDISAEERSRLGGLACAGYGLPGTDKLKDAVRAAFQSGAQTVLMVHHGAVICGRDLADVMDRVRLLEQICKRNCRGAQQQPSRADSAVAPALRDAVMRVYPCVGIADAAPITAWADLGTPLFAQLDDMAQMLGGRIDCVASDAASVVRALKKRDAVLVPGVGAVIRAENADDVAALALLAEKAAICAWHTRACKVRARLGGFDVALMRYVYLKKYAKRKDG